MAIDFLISFPILIFCMLMLVYYNHLICKSLFYPPFLITVIWLIVFLIYFLIKIFNFYPLDTISIKTSIYFIIGFLLFSISASFFYTIFEKVFYRFNFDSSPSRVNIYPLFILSLIVVPLSIRDGYNRAIENYILDNLFVSLRYSYSVEEESKLSFLSFSFIISIISSFNIYFNEHFGLQKNRFIKYVSFILLFISTLLSTGRTYVLLILCFFITISLKDKNILPKVFKYLLSIFIIFILFGTLLNKNEGFSDSSTSFVRSSLESVSSYLVGGIVSFDKFLNSNYQLSYGSETFRSFVLLGNKIGLTKMETGPLVKTYSQIPFDFNVYTIFYDYVKDFGIIFSFFLFLFYGCITVFTFCYVKNSNSRFAYLLYSIILYSSIMSFFQENFFTLAPFYIYMILFQIIFIRQYRPQSKKIV
jgi:oligosaccharide repeat unit polymerase